VYTPSPPLLLSVSLLRIEEVQREVDSLQVRNGELLEKLTTATTSNDAAKLDLARAEAAQEAAKSALEETQVEYDRMSGQATTVEQEVARLRSELAAVKADKAAVEAAAVKDENELAEQLARMEADAKEREHHVQSDIAAAHATLEAARAEALELDSRWVCSVEGCG
jgi:predicted  nucleic acid-binding Zn-ribbon protein